VRGFFRVFRFRVGPAPSALGNVCCLHCRLLVPHRGGTTHVWRCSPRGDAACRDRAVWLSAPEKPLGALVPSSSQQRRHVSRCPGRARGGRGAAHVTRARPSPPGQERARGPSKASGARLPCCFSTRAQYRGAPGGAWSHRPAALEQAPVRAAGSLLAPEVPQRGPAAAIAPVPRRQVERPAWPLGKRGRSGMSSNSTRRRLAPRPGTVRSRERGWATGTRALAAHKIRWNQGILNALFPLCPWEPSPSRARASAAGPCLPAWYQRSATGSAA
jgi:hypothetical protein